MRTRRARHNRRVPISRPTAGIGVEAGAYLVCPARKDGAVTATDVPRIVTPGSAPAEHALVPPMFPGGMLVDDREADALAAVIARKCLFRYYGPGEGPREVKNFEEEWCEAFGVPFALCVNAGSSAIICALIALGATAGTEVIVPAYTWNATANAVLAAGARSPCWPRSTIR